MTLKDAALAWAMAKKAEWEFMENAKFHREGTKAKARQNKREQALNDATEKASDEMFKAACELRFRDVSEEGVAYLPKALGVLMAVGIVADAGYDRDSMFEWEADVEQALTEEILEKLGGKKDEQKTRTGKARRRA